MFWRFLWWRSKKWFRERKMKKERRERRRKKKGEKMRDQKKEGNPWTLILSSPSFPSSSFLSFCTKTCHLPMIKVSLEDLSFCVLLLQSVFFFLSLLILVPHHFLTPRGSSPSYFSLRRVIIFGGRLTAGFAVNQRINYNNNNNWKVQGENHEETAADLQESLKSLWIFFPAGFFFPVSYISSSWSPLPLLVCN